MAKPNNQQLAEKLIFPLLEHIKNATYRGSWGGYDGAQQYVKSDRIQMLKNYGDAAYNLGLSICLNTIISSTVEKQNTAVLTSFVQEHPDFVVSMAKSKPYFFQHPDIQKLCYKALANHYQRSFMRYMKKHQQSASNENSL